MAPFSEKFLKAQEKMYRITKKTDFIQQNYQIIKNWPWPGSSGG